MNVHVASKSKSGEQRIYPIISQKRANPIKKNGAYLSLSACSWYAKKSKKWFESRDVTATVSLQLGEGTRIHSALGIYHPEDFSRLCPISHPHLLPSTKYTGGPLKFTVLFSGIPKNEEIASLVNSAASVSRSVASAFASNDSISSRSLESLIDASEEAVGGIQDIIQKDTSSNDQLFDPMFGMTLELPQDQILEGETYLLFHKGEELDPAYLSISSKEIGEIPLYKEVPLKNGSWVLLKLESLDAYPASREWQAELELFAFKLHDLVDRALNQKSISIEKAQKQFLPYQFGAPTLADTYYTLRTLIIKDAALCLAEKTFFLTGLQFAYLHTIETIKYGNAYLMKMQNERLLKEVVDSCLTPHTIEVLESNYLSLSESPFEYSAEGIDDFLMGEMKKDFKADFELDNIHKMIHAFNVLAA